jgi:hypothetical protein
LARKTFKNVGSISAPTRNFLDWCLKKSLRKANGFDIIAPLTSPDQKFSDAEIIKAGKWLDDQGIYDDKKLVISQGGREESAVNRSYQEKKNKILKMDSSYSVSKIFPAKSGAYASEGVFIDIGKKSLTSLKYEYKKPEPGTSLNGNETVKLDWNYSISLDETKSLTQTTDAYQVFFNTNSSSPHSYSLLDKGPQYGKRISIIENIEYMTHELSLYGDFSLSSGSVIELRVVKAGDPHVIRNSENGSSPSDIYDSVLSGKYLVTGISHMFGEDYFCRVRIKKDSPLFSLSK